MLQVPLLLVAHSLVVVAYAGIQDRRAVVKWPDYHRLQEVLELLRFLGELEWVALLRVRVDVCKVVAIACTGI